MLKTVKKILAAGAVLAVSSAAAQAQTTVKFDQPNMGFGTGPIVVESTDGVKWSEIKSSELKLPVAFFIGHNSDDYRMNYYAINQSGEKLYDQLIVNYVYANPFVKSISLTGSTDNFDSIARMNLLDACNSRLKTKDDIYKDQHLYFKVPLQLYAKFFRDNGTWFSKTAMGHSMVPVVCKAAAAPPSRKLKITNALFEAYATGNGNSCPKQRVVRVRLEGNKRTEVKLTLVRDDGYSTKHTVPVSIPGEHYQYFTLSSKWVKQSETRKYYMHVEGHKISIGWKTVAIKCPSGGDDGELANPTRPEQAKPKPNKPQIVVRPVKPTKPVRPVVDLATPRLKCIGGKVKANNCYCPRTHKKRKVAKHTYRCVKMTTTKAPKRVKPNKNKRKIARQNKQQTSNRILKRLKKAR